VDSLKGYLLVYEAAETFLAVSLTLGTSLRNERDLTERIFAVSMTLLTFLNNLRKSILSFKKEIKQNKFYVSILVYNLLFFQHLSAKNIKQIE
jgi:hypothetical protein